MNKATTMIAFFELMSGHDCCWEWPGFRDKDGYGRTKLNGKTTIAHRVAFILANGEIPEGMYVCHRCDNRARCRPEHLSLGTAKDNYEDAKAKDRHSRGERNGCSKLTAEQVIAIRRDRRTQMVIAAEYGIRQTTVSEIKNGNRWGHLNAD